MRGAFIVFEGPEGGGKTLQVSELSGTLQSAGYPTLVTREPGGTSVGEAIRSLLLGSEDYAILPETEVLLMAASRAQHVRQTIVPACEKGQIVLCDRFVDSTYAYQGGGRRLELEALASIQRFATGGLEPDLKLLLDLPVETGLRRRHAEPGSLNRIDRADLEFHQRVREIYVRLAGEDPGRWAVIDATGSPDKVASAIDAAVRARFAGASELSTSLGRRLSISPEPDRERCLEQPYESANE